MKQRYASGSAWKFIIPIVLLFIFQNNGFAQVTLGSSPYSQDFNGIGGGLPTGWTVRTGATATVLGTSVALTQTATSWGTSTGQFNNAASANAPSASTDAS